VFLPFVFCMRVSTVYVRNHYVADVFGGLITGTLGYVIGRWLMERRMAVEGEHRLKSVPLKSGLFECGQP